MNNKKFWAIIILSALIAGCSSSSNSEQEVNVSGLVPAAHNGSCASPTIPVAPPLRGELSGFISHQGRWLTDSYGRILLIHGINEVNKTSPYTPCASNSGFGPNSVDWIQSEGFSVVRLGVLFTGLMPNPGPPNSTYINDIASTVNLLAEHHIYSLLDFHQDGYGPAAGTIYGNDGFPAWLTITHGAVNTKTSFPLYYVTDPAIGAAFQSLWDNDRVSTGQRIQSVLQEGYKAVAEKFANDPWVLGYEILNEPWPGTNISLVDATNCLINSQCSNLNTTLEKDNAQLNSFYSGVTKAIRSVDKRHLIFGEPFVTFNFGESPAGIDVPGNDPNAGMAFHMYTLSASLEPSLINFALSWANGHDGALLNTEWDTSSDTGPIIRQSTELNNALIPWIYWAYVSNQNAVKMQDLDQAYPMAVSGIPTQYNYDVSTGVMTFAWKYNPSVKNPITTIETPKVTYPNGYSVKTINAKVISKGCGSILNAEMESNSAPASITITPGGNCS
jgi:endoglycosylceramidase